MGWETGEGRDLEHHKRPGDGSLLEVTSFYQNFIAFIFIRAFLFTWRDTVILFILVTQCLILNILKLKAATLKQ